MALPAGAVLVLALGPQDWEPICAVLSEEARSSSTCHTCKELTGSTSPADHDPLLWTTRIRSAEP